MSRGSFCTGIGVAGKTNDASILLTCLDFSDCYNTK